MLKCVLIPPFSAGVFCLFFIKAACLVTNKTRENINVREMCFDFLFLLLIVKILLFPIWYVFVCWENAGVYWNFSCLVSISWVLFFYFNRNHVVTILMSNLFHRSSHQLDKHVWTWKGRQGPGKGRSQASSQGPSW